MPQHTITLHSAMAAEIAARLDETKSMGSCTTTDEKLAHWEAFLLAEESPDDGAARVSAQDYREAQERRITQLERQNTDALDSLSVFKRELMLTQNLLREATEHIDDMATASTGAATDKLESELRREPHEVVIRVIIEQPRLTPATTPEENRAFDES